MQFGLFECIIKIMNNDVVKFDSVKNRILCYASFVDDRNNNSFLKKKILIEKMNACFREIHNDNFKNQIDNKKIQIH